MPKINAAHPSSSLPCRSSYPPQELQLQGVQIQSANLEEKHFDASSSSESTSVQKERELPLILNKDLKAALKKNSTEQPESLSDLSLTKELTLGSLLMFRKKIAQDSGLGEFLKTFTSLRSLILPFFPHIELEQILLALKDLANLKDLSINARNGGYSECVSELTQLESIYISDGSKEKKLPLFAQNTKLQELNAHSLGIESLTGLENCKHLRTIALNYCHNLKSLEGIENCSNLKELTFNFLYGLTSLIPLNNCAGITDVKIYSSKNLKNFEGLEKSASSLITLDCTELHSLTSLEVLKKALYLKVLRLSTCSIQSTKDLNCPELLTVDFSNCRELESLDGLEKCVKLKDADLSYLPKISSLAALEACKELEAINLEYTCEIKSLESLKNCLKLKTLNLAGCEKLHSLKGAPKNLEQIILDDCIGIVSLNDLKNCPYLKTIRLTGCENLDSLEGIEVCKNLTSVNLLRCPKIKSLKTFQSIKDLKEITLSDLQFCSWEIADLKKTCPQLVIKGEQDMSFSSNISYGFRKFTSFLSKISTRMMNFFR